jgi:hypothetical protein
MTGALRTHSRQDTFVALGDSQSSESELEHDTAVPETIDDRRDRQLCLRPGRSEGASLLHDQSDDSFGVGSEGPGEASPGLPDEFRDEPPLPPLAMDDDQSSGSLDEENPPPVRVVANHHHEQMVMSSGEDGDDEFEEDQEDRVRGAERPSIRCEANVGAAWQEMED